MTPAHYLPSEQTRRQRNVFQKEGLSTMEFWQLSFTLAFVSLTLLLSMWQKLALEKDLLIGTVRAAIQLIAVGYILETIFNLREWPYIIIMLVIMMTVAAQNAAKRGQGMPGIFWRVLVVIALAEIVSVGMMVELKIIQPTPQYIIPISGMMVGNSMVVSGLFLNRIQAEVNNRREEIQTALALGANSRQAIADILKNTVRSSMIPTIDSLKTVGLVQLPGMMTGLIVAGASPIQAVRYQLLIMYSITSTAAITSIALGFLVYKVFFNRAHQLIR